MLNDGVGRNFRGAGDPTSGARRDAGRDATLVLVVDPVLGSRFALVQAASQPGFVVDATASVDEAMRLLEKSRYAIVVADHDLGSESGVSFLARVRDAQLEVARVLVAEEDGFEFKRNSIREAGLSVVLTKPWSGDALRRTLRSLVGEGASAVRWEQRSSSAPGRDVDRASSDHRRQHELTLRGLLAGLNSCESEEEIYELLHAELARDFGIDRWVWVHDQAGTAALLVGDWPLEAGLAVEDLDAEVRASLDRARRCRRVARVDAAPSRNDRETHASLGWTLRIAGGSDVTGWVRADRSRIVLLGAVLRELRGGLELAFQRIRGAERRALAARELARRVSQELRTPMGALTHAIDRLRGEAERVGLSREWVDRVSSESERVARAVEHLEGEMLEPPSDAASLTSRGI